MANSETNLPNVDNAQFHMPDVNKLVGTPLSHPPRILLLYGSLRARSFSRLVVEESARLLRAMGAEVKIFNPTGLPQPDSGEDTDPKVTELRELMMWSEGQIDWVPLNMGGVRPTQGKTLAVMQVCGGSQSFNVVNQLRVLGRWMRMVTIPNQSSVAKAFLEFDDNDRMKPSPYYNRIVDVMEELMKFTLLLRHNKDYFVDRYSERVESAEQVSQRVNQRNL